MKTLRLISISLLLLAAAGCAGGWRGGAPPGEQPAAKTAAAPSAASTPAASSASATHATADGAVFVWKGEGATVAAAGDFNSWNTSADPLAKQSDGGWVLAKKLPAGRYAYKFVVDGTNWKPDPGATESVDDGYGGKNSVIVVGSGAAPAAAGSASTAGAAAVAGTAAAASSGASAQGGATTFHWSGPGNTVNVAGEFNSWNTSADPMSKQADGSWTLVKTLPPGRYAYKFVIDGTNWKEDPTAKESVDDGYGGKNSVVVVGGGAGAGAASAAPAAAATGAAAAAAGTGKAPVVADNGVTFTYAGAARSVAVAGDFNSWSTTTDPMKQQADGTWTLTKKLPSGAYGYKFVIDGTGWKQDLANSQSKDDGFGGKNSVVTVP